MLNKLLIPILILFLSACGGSGDGDTNTNTSTLSGTAATGAAFDGVVNIYGSLGGTLLDVPIDASGNYSADVAGLTPPYFITAIPADSSASVLYSFANNPGIANVTPFTTLAIFYANGGKTNPAAFTMNWPSSGKYMERNLSVMLPRINANFNGVFSAINPSLDTDFETYDFFKSKLVIGDTFDQILDLIEVDVVRGNPVVLINDEVFAYNPHVNQGNPAGLGYLTITGADTSVLGNYFVPTDVFSGTWSNQIGITFKLLVSNLGVTLQYDQHPNKVYGYEIQCFESNPAPDCSKITRESGKITFNNVELILDVFGGGVINGASAPIILNGTLF